MTPSALIVWRILDTLSGRKRRSPIHINKIKPFVGAFGYSPSAVASRLSELRKKGLVESPTPRYFRCAVTPHDDTGIMLDMLVLGEIKAAPPNARHVFPTRGPTIIRNDDGSLVVPPYVERYPEALTRRCWCKAEFATDLIAQTECPEHREGVAA